MADKIEREEGGKEGAGEERTRHGGGVALDCFFQADTAFDRSSPICFSLFTHVRPMTDEVNDCCLE